MSITVIKGGISSGKTTLCMDMIEKLHKTNRCIVLVNDKYSFETEKSYIKRFGGTGLNNIDVLTFRKLASEFIDTENMLFMDEAGRQMVVQRSIKEYLKTNPELSVNMLRTVSKKGFVQVMTSFVNELENHGTGSEQIRRTAEESDDSVFKEKIKVIADIYDMYNSIVDETEYTGSNRLLDLLTQKIYEDENLFKDTYVFVDCFNDMMMPRWNVIKAINSRAKQVYITLCVSEHEEERELYRINEKTLEQIEREYVIDTIQCGKHFMHISENNPELCHFLNLWESDGEYESTPENISVFKSIDIYKEIEHTACKIVDLVREEGYRYHDIAIVCSDSDKYDDLIEPIFREYGIPYFSDKKEMLQNHPIAIQITSLFDILENYFDCDDIFTYLKSGFIFRQIKSGKNIYYNPIPQEEIDELENYAIKYGIKGKKRWLDTENFAKELTLMQAAFEDGKDSGFLQDNSEKIEFIKSLHAEIITPIESFRKKSQKAKKGRDYAKALFEFLEDINIANGLEYEIYKLEQDNRIDEAQQYERIWELLLTVIDQLVITMGNDDMSLREFGDYIKSGILTCEIRLVPSGIDRVYVGSVEKNTVINIKVLFALGATEGTYQSKSMTEGFLSDRERDFLNSTIGRNVVAETTHERLMRMNYDLFELFAQASDRIFVSSYMYDTMGNQHSESALIDDIYKKFPKIKTENNFSLEDTENRIYISTPEATFHKLLINKSINKQKNNPLWDAVKAYFEDKEEYKERLHLLEGENEFFEAQSEIDTDYAHKLYGDKINYSKSKIDEYAKCPYRFFLNYGLGIKDREEWEISKADLGSYAHEIIEKFCSKVESGADTPNEKLSKWKSLTDTDREEILDGIFRQVNERMKDANINQKAKLAHIMGRMNKVINKTTKTITDCFVHGKYTIKSMENEITVPISEEVNINGFIDRIDELERNGKKNIRIIDYKTGQDSFNIKNIYNGVDMQMPIYGLAAKYHCEQESGEECDVTGMYFTKLRGELKKNLDEVEKLKKLDGVTFEGNGEDVLADMDDSVENNTSILFPVKFKIDGTLDKRSAEKIRTKYEGERLMDFVKNKILEFDDNIRNKGDIRSMPYEKSCDYCDYSRVCALNECKKKRSVEGKNLSTDEIWNKIAEKKDNEE